MYTCIHELQIGTCSLCKSPPMGIHATVYITKAGNVFHNDSNCEWLLKGQNQADKIGYRNHPIMPIAWGKAATSRGPGESCCSSP